MAHPAVTAARTTGGGAGPARLADALAVGPVVLDGGLATRLEARGNDLSSPLWSARMLLDDPAEVVAAHRDYFAAGAQVATTASYQASFDGLAAAGLDRLQTRELLLRSVRLATHARDETVGDGRPRWIAASIGPYGAARADGSEYRGDCGLTVDELRRWHRPRLAVLAESGADVLALETIPCAAEAEALMAEVSGLGIPAWLSVTGVLDRSAAGGSRVLTRAGEDAAELFAMAADVEEIVAVGVNCCDPDELAAVAVAASHKVVVAYPNSGEGWDVTGRRWTGPATFGAESAAAYVDRWLAAGVRLIGGCCRVGPDTIAAVAAAVTDTVAAADD